MTAQWYLIRWPTQPALAGVELRVLVIDGRLAASDSAVAIRNLTNLKFGDLFNADDIRKSGAEVTKL